MFCRLQCVGPCSVRGVEGHVHAQVGGAGDAVTEDASAVEFAVIVPVLLLILVGHHRVRVRPAGLPGRRVVIRPRGDACRVERSGGGQAASVAEPLPRGHDGVCRTDTPQVAQSAADAIQRAGTAVRQDAHRRHLGVPGYHAPGSRRTPGGVRWSNHICDKCDHVAAWITDDVVHALVTSTTSDHAGTWDYSSRSTRTVATSSLGRRRASPSSALIEPARTNPGRNKDILRCVDPACSRGIDDRTLRAMPAATWSTVGRSVGRRARWSIHARRAWHHRWRGHVDVSPGTARYRVRARLDVHRSHGDAVRRRNASGTP